MRVLALSSECDDYTLSGCSFGGPWLRRQEPQSMEMLKLAISEVLKGRVFLRRWYSMVRQKLRVQPKSFPSC